MKTDHLLKTQQPSFADILSGKKTFDVRKADRVYRVGDIVTLREWSDEKGWGRLAVDRRIVCILTEEAAHGGLNRGYVVLGLGQIGGG